MADHFVETNIVIGYTVDWDRQSPVVREYLDSRTSSTNIHTSPRVLEEAEDVINDRRRAAKQAARLVFEKFEAGNRHPPVDQIVDFVRSELSHERGTVVDHVIQHVKDNEYYYSGLTQTSADSALASTVSDIDADFDQPVTVVEGLRNGSLSELDCRVFTGILTDYRSTYPCFSSVDGILTGSPVDRDILLDAYHLTQEDGLQLLCFVTLDRHFLDNESDLESELKTIDIESPETA